MPSDNSNSFHTPDESPEKPTFELFPIGVEYPPNPPRPFYMVQCKRNIFPTLTGEIIDTMPFYVSTGTNFSREQKNKLSCFSGISYMYRDGNGSEFISLLNYIPLLENLVLQYINSKYKGKKKSEKDIEGLFMNNMCLNTWFIKLGSSIHYDSNTATVNPVEKYDRKWPGFKEVTKFLGSEVCTDEIKTAVSRAPSYENANRYNKSVARYLRNGGVLETEFHNDFNEGIRNRVKEQESTFVVRYCSNLLFHSLRNRHRKTLPDYKTKLNKFEVNQIIGDNNLFGKHLNSTNLKEDVIDTGLEIKYKRILNFVLMNIYLYMFPELHRGQYIDYSIEKFIQNFNSIMSEPLFVNPKKRNRFKDINEMFKINKIREVHYCDGVEFDDIIEQALIVYFSTYDTAQMREDIKGVLEARNFIKMSEEELFDKIKGFFTPEDDENVKLLIEYISLEVKKTKKILEIEKSNFFTLMERCEEIFEELVSEKGQLDVKKAEKYKKDTDILDFIALPLYEILKASHSEIYVKDKRNLKKKKKKLSMKKKKLSNKKKKLSMKKKKISKKGKR